MPVYACPNGKFRIGTGPCMYTSKADAERAYRAYLAVSNECQALETMKPWMAKLFNYDLKLAQEWAGYVKEGLEMGAPDEYGFAWDRFLSRYCRTRLGSWIVRPAKFV